MATNYTVQRGDCLWTIAKKQLGAGTRWGEITRPGGVAIPSPYTIYTGETLVLPGGGGTDPVNTSNKATDIFVGMMAGSNNTLYATWNWSKDHTKSYKVKWYYDNGSGVWFVGSESENTVDKTLPDDARQSTYNIPENTNYVIFKVKPVSETYKVNDTDTDYWTAEWASPEKMTDCSTIPLQKPSTPTVTLDKFKLTATLENLDSNVKEIEFQIVSNETTVFNTGKASVETARSVSYSCNIQVGHSYKVRCRSYRNTVASEWSDFSSKVETMPVTTDLTVCRAASSTSVYLEWTTSATAKTYDIEYATKKEYFDGSDSTQTVTGIEQTHYTKTGLDSGREYFFRVRAVNQNGESAWSAITSVTIGKKPAAPTTWSSNSTVTIGETLALYWVHNSSDNSNSKYAELELWFGTTKQTVTVQSPEVPEEESEKTHCYYVDTSSYPEGTKLKWRVRTAGVTLEYGDWSIQRTVDIYAPATVTLTVSQNGASFSTLTAFPFRVQAVHGPRTQAPISYHLTVTSKTTYETVDSAGLQKRVVAGDEVYSKHFDISTSLDTTISASDIDLANNASYVITCVVSLNSGLNATATKEFAVRWTDREYSPNAEIGYDKSTYSTYIKPFCRNENNQLINGILLSVYRREFNGKFTEIIKDVDNTKNVFVVDPHPALDFARYRIVAKTTSTGAISYYDVPGYPVQEKAILIQWNETWSNFNADQGQLLADNPWSGSLVRLPYNVDVSDSNSPDSSLVSYIGRSHPVSYYGTQLGSSATWKVDIEKSDIDTLYALRRLACWMGDVYVREPSGSGYWASVTVSFSQTHNKLVIPVTINVKRVEGGV